jgi:hypothetical protein
MAAGDRREIGPEREIRSRNVRILRHVRVEVVAILGEATTSHDTVGIGVTERKSPGSAAAAPLVLDQVGVNVEAVGPHHCDATGQLLARSVPGCYGTLLVLRAKIVVINTS